MPHPPTKEANAALGTTGKLTGEEFSYGTPPVVAKADVQSYDGKTPPVGSDVHNRLLRMVISRLNLSYSQMQTRQEMWKKTERSYRLFVAPEEVMEPNERVSDHQEALWVYPTSVVIPMSMSVVQTLIAFWVTLFTSSMPYIRVGNRSPESAGAAKAQELLVSYQLEHNRYVLLLYQWFLDACRYGVGVLKNYWDVQESMRSTTQTLEVPTPQGIVRIPIKQKKSVLDYEGNTITAIDPFNWRPDPRHPVAEFQKGSFCGESIYRSYFSLLRDQKSGMYSNVEDIPNRTTEEFSRMNRTDRERITKVNQIFNAKPDDLDTYMCLVEECPMDFIPKEVGVDKSDEVERWIVTIANRSVVIRAEPFVYEHGQFTYAMIESSPDLHSMLNPGIMELMDPIAQHISWIWNSHLENIRKALNDRFLVDPSMVEMDDVLNPSASQYIRLNPSAYGRGNFDGILQQFPVQDVTFRGIQTTTILQDFLQRASGASDAIQGQPRAKRSTATEIAAAAQQAALRLRMLSKIFSSQGLVPLTKQMVMNNQTFMSQDMYLKIVGSLANEYRNVGTQSPGGTTINPEQIQGQFDFPIFDATTPLDPTRYAEVWMNLAKMSVEHPILAQQVDHVAMFRQIANALGVSDISRFLMPQQVQVMPNQQVDQQVQAGNLVPFGGGAATGNGGGGQFSPEYNAAQANPRMG